MRGMNASGERDHRDQPAGKSTPVVYVHGAFSSPSVRRGLLKTNATGRPTITPTMPGLGAPLPAVMSTNYSIENEVEHLASLIRVETNAPVHLVGHSYGGLIVYAAALAKRFDITGCTLFEPLTLDLLKRTGDNEALDELAEFLDAYRTAHESGDPWAVRLFADEWSGEGFLANLPERVQLAMAAMTGFNLQQWAANFAFAPSLDEIRDLSIAIILVQGGATHRLCKLVNERLHELLPNSRFIEVEGASHFLIQSHAGICAGIVDQDVEVRF